MIEGFCEIYYLEENNKERKFEIRQATIQERIQKNRKLDGSEQLILANVNVIKKVVMQFFKNGVNFFFL